MLRLHRDPHPLTPANSTALMQLLAGDAVAGVQLGAQISRWNYWGRGDVVACGTPQPHAGAWATGSLILYGQRHCSPSELKALASHGRPRLTRRGSVMGPADDVAALWPYLDQRHLAVRQARWNQPLLLAPPAKQVAQNLAAASRSCADELVVAAASQTQAAQVGMEPLVLPAAVAMFKEEVGFDPLSSGSGYGRHISQLIEQGRSYVLLDDGAGHLGNAQVAFKADVGSLWNSVAQITGVWTRPDLRGRGLAKVALGRVLALIYAQHQVSQINLYVNDFNVAALGLYKSLGFTQVGTMSTVLL